MPAAKKSTASKTATSARKSKADRDLEKRQREARAAQGVDLSGAGNPVKRPNGRVPADHEQAIANAPRSASKGGSKSSHPRATDEQMKKFPEMLIAFANKEGSEDYDAPIQGEPFVHNGRLFFKAAPMIEWAERSESIEITPSQLREAVAKLHGDRAPFGFKLNGKQTGASHYSVPLTGKIKSGVELDERKKPEPVASSAKKRQPVAAKSTGSKKTATKKATSAKKGGSKKAAKKR